MPPFNFLAVSKFRPSSNVQIREPDQLQALSTDTPQSSKNSRKTPRRASGEKRRSATRQTHSQNLHSTPLYQAIHTWRKKDNRNWKDIEVEEFPNTFFYNLHQQEWERKKELASSLIRHIAYHPSAQPAILDVGCGCGWLSHYFVQRSESTVTGIDLDAEQIFQAKKVFSHKRLSFYQEEFFQGQLPKQAFDLIIIMHALPWMPDLASVVKRSKALLRPEGQLHILGTPFEPARRMDKARNEWEEYCEDKQMESVLPHYQLFSKQDLMNVQAEVLSGDSLWKSLLGTRRPADWVMVRR